MNVLLTEPQVEKLVQRYLLEMARYERTAAVVAERLRRELRAEAQLRYLLAFRAKHPEDLRVKLLRKAKEGKAEYSYDRLNEGLNDVVTDLAGCRVIVYSPPDRLRVSTLVRRIFRRPDRSDADARRISITATKPTTSSCSLPTTNSRLVVRSVRSRSPRSLRTCSMNSSTTSATKFTGMLSPTTRSASCEACWAPPARSTTWSIYC